jgi:hypothetical protein
MSVIIIINNNPVEVPEDACMEIMHLRSENAALREALKKVKKSLCRSVPDFHSKIVVVADSEICDQIINAALKRKAKS